MDLKQITERNYRATEKRGLITHKTNHYDFLRKLKEEVNEFEESFQKYGLSQEHLLECIDIILVCFAYLFHYDFSVKKLLKMKVKINEKRKD